MSPSFAKVTSMLTFCLLLAAFGSTGQETRFGIKTGINASIFSVSVNSDPEFKTGFHFGAYAKITIKEKLFFRPEIYYSAQGQKDNYILNSGTTTTSVNYLNVPLLFEVGKKISFQFGPQIGFLLSAHEKGTINGVAVNDDLKEIMKGTDLALVVGVSASLSENVNLGIRLNKGISNIFKDSSLPDPVQNNVFHFYLGYLF